MRVIDRSGGIAAAAGLVLVASLGLSVDRVAATPAGMSVPDMAVDAWEWQARSTEARDVQRRANVDRDAVAPGNQRGDDADRGEARGNQGRGSGQAGGNGGQARGNSDQARGNSSQARGNSDQARGNSDQARGNSGQARSNSGQARGNSDQARGAGDNARGAAGNRGRGNAAARARANPAEVRAHVDRLPEEARRFANSSRRGERIAGQALARASLRGTDASRFRIDKDGSRVRVRNSRNEVLLDLSDEEARELGHWRMRRLGDSRPTEGSPAFCRSGEGHPVWGREWCLDKGFGLGSDSRSIWSRSRVDDVIFKGDPQHQVTLDRGGLIDVLGDVVLGRLAVHSLTLGYQEPLAGRWVRTADEPEAPWLLRVSAGDAAVAEFVDMDRDNDVDVLYVVQPRW